MKILYIFEAFKKEVSLFRIFSLFTECNTTCLTGSRSGFDDFESSLHAVLALLVFAKRKDLFDEHT